MSQLAYPFTLLPHALKPTLTSQWIPSSMMVLLFLPKKSLNEHAVASESKLTVGARSRGRPEGRKTSSSRGSVKEKS